MDLSIIINNYKSKEKTYKAVGHILASGLFDLKYEIIVIDNASGDGIGREISHKYPKVKFIQSEKNTGMGGGNNLGIKNSSGEYILILNPDVYVKSDTIKKLREYFFQNNELGIVAPRLLNPDGTIQDSCFRFPKFYTPILRRTFLGKVFKGRVDNFLMNGEKNDKIKEVDWVMGSCFMIKRSLCEKEDCFDERFFMYFEDTDLCRRIKSLDFKVMYCPEVSAIHDHARASAKDIWLFAIFTNQLTREHIKSWVKYFKKWGIK